MRGAKLSVRTLLVVTSIVLFIFLILQPIQVFHFQDYIAVLFPRGEIALKERNLLLIIQGIMLLVILPVYTLTFIFSWRYGRPITKPGTIPIWSIALWLKLYGGASL